jgi:hypothetical protein
MPYLLSQHGPPWQRTHHMKRTRTSLAKMACRSAKKCYDRDKSVNMLEFKTWFCQIVTTCELVASQDALQRTWISREKSITSITDFGELYEQVFGDLDPEACLTNFGATMNRETFQAVERFLITINVIDFQIRKEPELQQPERLFVQSIWKILKDSAACIIALPDAQPCRSRRQDIQLNMSCTPGQYI